jgi:hypothetical protein
MERVSHHSRSLQARDTRPTTEVPMQSMSSRPGTPRMVALSALLLGACTGNIGDPAGGKPARAPSPSGCLSWRS